MGNFTVMKTIITLLLVLVSHFVMAQVKFDTIPKPLLLSDSSKDSRANELVASHLGITGWFTWAIFGYEVIAHDEIGEIHVSYLDEKKRKISGYYVWQLK